MNRPLEQLAADALACLLQEHAAAHEAMRAAVGERCVVVSIEAERFAIQDGVVVPASGVPTIEIRTDAATVHAVLHGDIAPIDAVLGGRLDAYGAVDDLVAIGAAVTMFVKGAVRCPSMRSVIARLSSNVRGGGP